MAKKKMFQETRGRKKASDPLEPVTIYVNNSLIVDDNGKVLDNKSEEYRVKLDALKRKLTVHFYENMANKSSSLALSSTS